MHERVLILGGAGYIGSHMVKHLARSGCSVRVFDNLATGHADAAAGCDFVRGDVTSASDLDRAFSGERIDAVMHFAASAYVGESVSDPAKYYSNNVVGTLQVLEAMCRHGVRNLIFSSSCTVYGVPRSLPISEAQPRDPISPYGMTKYACERMSADFAAAYGMRAVSLRYFNAAGCDPEGELGERHDPETHLIPLVLLEALRVSKGGDPADTTLRVFGDGYPTRDGTCVRDYVHVMDLAAAHQLAMQRMLADKVEGSTELKGATGFEAYNLGNERGFSVREVIEVARSITGIPIRYRVVGARPGDPAELVADAGLAQRVLGWTPQHASLEAIVGSAWNWFRVHGGATSTGTE